MNNSHMFTTEVTTENDKEIVSIKHLAPEGKKWTFSTRNTKETKIFLMEFLPLIGSRVPIDDINKEGSI